MPINIYSVGSKKMPFTAWKHKERNRNENKKQTNVFIKTSGGYMITLGNNFRAYLLSILKTLVHILSVILEEI